MAGRYTGVNVRQFLDDLQRQELLDTGRIKLTSRGRNLELGAGFFDDAAQYDLAKIAGGLKMPVLAVHGNSDEIIPVDEAVQAARINPGHIENRIVEGADHMFSEESHRRFAAESIAEWFVKQRK
jgi:pimeloyl-ACP methyl ester carboxylesterase